MNMSDEKFVEYVESCQEVELYFMINELGGFVWRMTHDMNKHGRIPEKEHPGIRKDVIAMQVRAGVAVDHTTRFGVVTPREPKKSTFTGEEHVGPSDDYWLWFRWWDAWSKSLSDEVFNEMDADMSAKRDLSKWRPDGEWKVADAATA